MGLPIVYTMVWYQKLPVAIASLKVAQYLTPADLKGKKIGTRVLSGASYNWHWKPFLESRQLERTRMSPSIPSGFTQVNPSSPGSMMLSWCMERTNPSSWNRRGYPVDVITVSDYLPNGGETVC